MLTSVKSVNLRKVKGKRSLKGTVVKPIQSPDFASRCQVDLIDFQNSDQVNRLYNFLLVYQDHHTKFIVLRPQINKSAEEVFHTLFDLSALLVHLTSTKVTTA